MREFAFQPDWREVKQELAARLREIRTDLYGDHGGPMLAEELGIPFRSWAGYESGASMPGPVMLRFLQRTGANPHWLLTGAGPRYAPKRRGR
jgi:hypothetical protein